MTSGEFGPSFGLAYEQLQYCSGECGSYLCSAVPVSALRCGGFVILRFRAESSQAQMHLPRLIYLSGSIPNCQKRHE